MDSISAQVGKKIREYRQQAGLTQENLALNSGINISFLGDIERGIKKPSIESLEKILKALNMTFQEFFDFETNVKPFKNCNALKRLNLELQNYSDEEIEMIYNIVKQIIVFNGRK